MRAALLERELFVPQLWYIRIRQIKARFSSQEKHTTSISDYWTNHLFLLQSFGDKYQDTQHIYVVLCRGRFMYKQDY